jgi:hypothetical protein
MAMCTQLEKLDRKIKYLTNKRNKLIDKMQSECPHPTSELLEVPFYDRGWLGSDSPMRLCKACGLAEEGWGCGYWRLERRDVDLPRIERFSAFTYVLRFYSQEEMNKLRFRRDSKTPE